MPSKTRFRYAARACGASVIVDKFTDPIGLDAVVQWPGRVDMQLYWHFKKPSYAALSTVPVNWVLCDARYGR